MEKEVSVAMPMTVIFSVLAAAGIVLAVICLVFNCIFRNRKLVVHCICMQCINFSSQLVQRGKGKPALFF